MAAMRFKQAVVSRVGLEEAFDVTTSVLDVPGTDIVRERPMRSLRDVAQERGTLRELWPASPPFVLPAPHVIGTGNHRPITATGRSTYLARLDDVQVRGRSHLVLSDGDAVIDYEADELARFSDYLEFDPAVLHATRDEVWTLEPLAPSMAVDEAFMLTGSYTREFGHWMMEHLPRYVIARLCGLPPDTPVLVDERMPASHLQSLELIRPPGAPVVVVPHLAPVAVRHLWCAPNPMYAPPMSREAGVVRFHPTELLPEFWGQSAQEPRKTAALTRALLRLAGPDLDHPTGIDRVYLARTSQWKKLLNAVDIEAAAEARGFVVVRPEELPFVEQLRLARHARYVVGPEGSALLLCSFCPAGARVCILSPPDTVPLAETAAALHALDVETTIVTGDGSENDYWSDYEIDPVVFADFLDRWLSS